MQSIFRLPWCGDQIASKMSEKPSFDQMRSSPAVEIPGLSHFKRKRTSSPEPQMTPQSLAKKPRAVGDFPQRLPLDIPQLPAKLDHEQTNPASLAYATPGATPTTAAHRSDYLSIQPDNSVSKVELKNISQASSRKDSAVLPSRNGSTQQGSEDVTMEEAPATVKPETVLQQAIENQFNMQILLKHNELRLIDQELAKCQVALEQLRRCELRPFPGSDKPTESVSAGTGPAVNPQPGFSKPSHAAPYGVVDGPYSRHYSKWLLGDSQFDSNPIRDLSFAESAAFAASRPTRNSGSARKSAGKSISNIPGEFMPSIPNYPAAPARKEKSGPLILRRSSDGKLVKLVCNNCNRGDMNSIQGFLNHCRIAHKVDYKSHDQAALDCGRLLDDAEIASLPADAGNMPLAKGAPKAAAARASVSSAPPMHATVNAAVHPFNIPGAALPTSSRKPTKKRTATPARPLAASPANNAAPSTFKPSTQAPRLSALFAKNNLGGDLNQAVTNAKLKIDLSGEEDTSSPDLSTPSSPSAPKKSTNSSMPVNTSTVPRPPSRKGHRQPHQRSRPAPLAPHTHQLPPSNLAMTPTLLPDSPLGMSAHSSRHTIDSNPGMISDLEDDDHGSASEEETALPPSSRGSMLPVNSVSRSCADNSAMDLDVSVDDEMDEHGVIIRRNSMLASDVREHQRKLTSTASPSKLG
jgi:ADA HAT complex component 1